MSSLGEEYPKEQARCRELISQYEGIGPAGAFGKLTIEQVLQRADKAMADGDTIKMIGCFQEMQACK